MTALGFRAVYTRLTLVLCGLLAMGACGVEETGFLTAEGVYFTEDPATSTHLLVIRPEAVTVLTGDLSGETSNGEQLESQVLDSEGIAWVFEPADLVTLSYTFYEEVDSADYSVVVSPEDPPVEDTTGLINWVVVDGASLSIEPSLLIGELPFLIVNQANGQSIVLTASTPATLAGASGNRVCASSLVDTTATASVCTTAL